MLLKQKSLSFSSNLFLGTFGKLLIVFSTKVFCYTSSINGREVLPSTSDKAELFAKNFITNSNLDDLGISLPVFSSRTNLKLRNISYNSQNS